jgi:hypothetical protein
LASQSVPSKLGTRSNVNGSGNANVSRKSVLRIITGILSRTVNAFAIQLASRSVPSKLGTKRLVHGSDLASVLRMTIRNVLNKSGIQSLVNGRASVLRVSRSNATSVSSGTRTLVNVNL